MRLFGSEKWSSLPMAGNLQSVRAKILTQIFSLCLLYSVRLLIPQPGPRADSWSWATVMQAGKARGQSQPTTSSSGGSWAVTARSAMDAWKQKHLSRGTDRAWEVDVRLRRDVQSMVFCVWEEPGDSGSYSHFWWANPDTILERKTRKRNLRQLVKIFKTGVLGSLCFVLWVE